MTKLPENEGVRLSSLSLLRPLWSWSPAVPSGTLMVLKYPYPWRVEEPSIYESVRVHTAVQTGRTESDLVPNAPSVISSRATQITSRERFSQDAAFDLLIAFQKRKRGHRWESSSKNFSLSVTASKEIHLWIIQRQCYFCNTSNWTFLFRPLVLQLGTKEGYLVKRGGLVKVRNITPGWDCLW